MNISPSLRSILYDLARYCGGFVIKQDGVIESVWVWDQENDKPKRVR